MSSVPCDKWVILKIFEFLLCVSCVVCKRVTDDETSRVHLILQRFSREWSLLGNVTWGRVGAALADATYGGYVIITAGLLIARLTREMPQGRRITEFFLLGLGSILFVLLACLELFGVDELPDDLVDNAAVLGSLSMAVALLFLIDLAGPRKISKKASSQTTVQPFKIQLKPVPKQQEILTPTTTSEIETTFPATIETELITDWEPYKPIVRPSYPKSTRASQTPSSTVKIESIPDPPSWMKAKPTTLQLRTNGISSQTGHHSEPIGILKRTHSPTPIDSNGFRSKSPSTQLQINTNDLHSPVWSQIRATPQRSQAESISPVSKQSVTSFLLPMPPVAEQENSSPESAPSSPIDPGYVQYAASKWGQGQPTAKTPRHSPTEV